MKQGIRIVSFFLVLLTIGCGKKGPPLPPLVRFPAAPADFHVVRRGNAVSIQFVVPSANTDGSTPADLERVDVYALTGLPTLTPEEIVRRGTRVGSVHVNPARDPDEPEDEAQPVGPKEGIDQGATPQVVDSLPLDQNADADEVRSYFSVGFNKRGRRGAFSTRGLVPIGPAPAAPAQPTVTWNETSIAVAWPDPPAAADPPTAYQVYAVEEVETRLTEKPIERAPFVDRRIEWGASRCYTVSTVETQSALTLESEASPSTCVTLVDTFPPAAPVGLTAIAGEGVMNLIWDANAEGDVAGYNVLRAIAPERNLSPVNTSPVDAPTFKDTVPAGARVTYAVQAVDKAGNVSPMSGRVEETAR